MTYDEAIEGLTILKQYVQGTAWVDAEHDMVFASGVDLGIVKPTDRTRLFELGWVWGEYDCWHHHC